MPVIDIQRRAVEVGRIRAGDKDAKGNPRKGKNWRLTSRDEVRLTAASRMWGGKVQPWADRDGEFELYTSTDTLPIMLMPGVLPTTWYEMWSAGGCQRRCDGRHEIISDAACMCNPDERECNPHTRLSVMLPDLPGIGAWLLQSTGFYAASELAAVADILQRGAGAGVLLPARLILEQREDKKPGKPTHKYVVPVISIDVSFNELIGSQGAAIVTGTPTHEPIGATGTPALPPSGVSVADGLAAVQTERHALPRANAAEPVGLPIVESSDVVTADASDDDSGETGPSDTTPSAGSGVPGATAGTGLGEHVPVPSPDEPGAVAPGADDAADGASEAPSPPPPRDDSDKRITRDQSKALNALYGELKEIPTDDGGNPVGNPAVTVGGLYAWAAKERNINVDEMIASMTDTALRADPPKTPPRDAKGKLHFPPLRDSLTKAEASKMIDGMVGIQEKIEAAS